MFRLDRAPQHKLSGAAPRERSYIEESPLPGWTWRGGKEDGEHDSGETRMFCGQEPVVITELLNRRLSIGNIARSTRATLPEERSPETNSLDSIEHFLFPNGDQAAKQSSTHRAVRSLHKK